MDGYLIPEQIGVLLAPIKEHRVGRDGKNYSHVEAYELRAHLNRLFGFCRWSEDVLSQTLVFEEGKQEGQRTKWTVCYHTVLRLTVHAPDGTLLATYTEGAMGDAQNQPSRADAHDLAAKTSASQAFKRCCMNLGDSFGLSLYRGGSMEPLVKVTLVNGEGGAAGSHEGDVQDAAPETFRPPDRQPEQSTAGGTKPPQAEPPGERAPPAAPDAGGAEAEGPPRQHPEKRTADDYRALLMEAADRPAVIHLMRELETDGLGGEDVGHEDGSGEFTKLRDLASRRLKAVHT